MPMGAAAGGAGAAGAAGGAGAAAGGGGLMSSMGGMGGMMDMLGPLMGMMGGGGGQQPPAPPPGAANLYNPQAVAAAIQAMSQNSQCSPGFAGGHFGGGQPRPQQSFPGIAPNLISRGY